MFLSFAVSASDIVISKGVASAHRKKLEYDFNFLKNLQFSDDTDPRTLAVLGIDELTNESAQEWLKDRVSYIVENQDFKFFDQLLIKKKIVVLENNVHYEDYVDNDRIFIPGTVDDKTKGKAVVVMTNIGTGIYKLGKDTKRKFGFQMYDGMFQEKINIPVESPRTGIIQIGEGLFANENVINTRITYAISNSIKRLATIFHEARHSDGNKKSMGFYHSNCPKGHDLEGISGCDENLNGPYTVGALMMKEMAKACDKHCMEFEKEMLRISVLDSFNRVQKIKRSGSHSINLDATPEAIE